MKYIDLRSDTVTKPSAEMRSAMMKAEVGDDVFGEDPTVNLLQERMAALFGKDQALFVASGTMGNEICIKAQTEPGDEIIVEKDSHVFVYETAGPSFLAGVQMQPVAGKKGVMNLEEIERVVRPQVYYMPKTRLICLENTHGRSGGAVVPLEYIKSLNAFARDRKIRLHLDGARLWNASVATGISVREYAQYFDSVSVCFSKGLGAPVGSMLLGDGALIDRARRYRKIFGGGMRQVGILAAACIYALDHNIARLSEDHRKAKLFANTLNDLSNISLSVADVESNMVIIDIKQTEKTQDEVLNLLKNNGVLMTPERHSSIRAVMHLDVSVEQVQEAANIFVRLFS